MPKPEPKPPEGCDDWLSWLLLGRMLNLRDEEREYEPGKQPARLVFIRAALAACSTELATLREKAEKNEADAKRWREHTKEQDAPNARTALMDRARARMGWKQPKGTDYDNER